MRKFCVQKNTFLNGLVFLVLAQIMVGMNIVVSKLLLPYFPVLVLLEIRFLLATLVLLPLHWVSPVVRKKSLKSYLSALTKRDWYYITAQALAAGFLFNIFMLTGLNYTDANVSGIITSALPALIAVMSWFILREKISSQKVLCVFFATVGLLIIAYDKLHEINASHSFFGDCIVLLALFPEASYYVLCKLYKNQLPVFLASTVLNGINALILLPVLFFISWDPVHISALHWVIISVIGISTGLFYVFWFIGSQKVDGIMASLSTGIMPIATAVFAWIILGEKLTGFELVGMSLVLLSIVVYAKK